MSLITPAMRSYLGPVGKQGWRSGESTRLPLMWPGFDSLSQIRRLMWAEFVGSLSCSEYSGFPLSPKTYSFKL